jgi:hypothetical protein
MEQIIAASDVMSTKPGALRSLTCVCRLHAAGHVQSLEYNSEPDLLSFYFRVNVKPAMKTSETYVVVVKLNSSFGRVMAHAELGKAKSN